MQDLTTRSVMVFSPNYLPMGRINLRRALVLPITGKAHLDYGQQPQGWVLTSVTRQIYVPQYIRLTLTQVEHLWKIPSVNRRGVHIWKKLVTACQRCNQVKGNRTLDEARLTLSH